MQRRSPTLAGCASVVAATLLLASAAHAQVAIAPVVQKNDALHRDVVGEIALKLGDKYQMLSPQLTVDAVTSCGDDVACILELAKARGASHLVIVTAAPLGPRDQVVAARLYATRSGAKLFEESAVLGTTRDLRRDARGIGDRLTAVPGPPLRPQPEQPAETESEPGVGALTWVGLSLLGASVVAGTVTAVTSSVALGGSTADGTVAATSIVVGSIAAGALAAGGVGLLAADAL